jgi:hypothetical protein
MRRAQITLRLLSSYSVEPGAISARVERESGWLLLRDKDDPDRR